MVNTELLAKAKPSAVLINTARGAIVDLDALHLALEQGQIAGAALDVLPEEPPPSHPLIEAYRRRDAWLEGRLILTPHVAFYSAPGFLDLRRKGIETILDYLREGRLRNCVNRDLLEGRGVRT